MTWSAEAAADIHAALADPVIYNGAGLTNEEIDAIKSDVEAGEFQGAGNTLRQVSFEVRQSALLEDPAKGDTIAEDGNNWKVNEIIRRDDIGAWWLIVEEAQA